MSGPGACPITVTNYAEGKHMADAVDMYMEQWTRERPELETAAMSVIARLSRAGKLLNGSIRESFRTAEIEPWEFDVLATLLRIGRPHTLTPKQLVATMMVGGPAMTHRIDKLVKRGLVSRQVDAGSRRQLLVSLTPQGLQLADLLVVDHVNNSARFLQGLNAEDRKSLNRILRTLLLAHGDEAPPSPATP